MFFCRKYLDIVSVATIMPVFAARCSMTFLRSADRPLHHKASRQLRLGAKVNHITHFFFDRRLNER